jgi:Mce-associated membrane protein
MSPRRRIAADEPDYFAVMPKPQRQWGLPIVAAVTALLMAAAITISTLMFVSHEQDRSAEVRDASALGYVSEFMINYTSLDPFNANAYVDRILAKGTGEFAKMFKEKEPEILIQVARAEPTNGQVMAAGVQRWADNGSADILVATKVTSKSPDGKTTVESGNRWIATVIKEGQQWKISRLIQVI